MLTFRRQGSKPNEKYLPCSRFLQISFSYPETFAMMSITGNLRLSSQSVDEIISNAERSSIFHFVPLRLSRIYGKKFFFHRLVQKSRAVESFFVDDN